jgi:Na+/melibiose symporter-like transporter
MMRNRLALLTALGVDNFGSGLFLPLALLYATRVIRLPLATAGTVIALGTLAGLAAPPLAGRLVDAAGPRVTVICAQLLQALGAVTYLVARDAAAVAAAAVLLGVGQQAFYSSLFALISDVAGEGPKDRPFAVAAMVRSACFGVGGLAAGGLLSAAGPAAYRIAVAADAGSFAACALLLALLVDVARPRRSRSPAAAASSLRLLSDRPFLALIAIAGLVSLPGDVFLTGMAVYVLGPLHARPWLPGALLALLTGLTSMGGTASLRATRRLRRTTAMALGALGYLVWCAAALAAILVPPGWRPAELLAATLLMAAAGLLFQRANALAEALAPRAVRGRYLAAFQYAFTVPWVIAPAVVALFSVAVWLPWLVGGTAAGLAAVALPWLARRLPGEALHPEPAAAPQVAVR